jgi:hypothetical protein
MKNLAFLLGNHFNICVKIAVYKHLRKLVVRSQSKLVPEARKKKELCRYEQFGIYVNKTFVMHAS